MPTNRCGFKMKSVALDRVSNLQREKKRQRESVTELRFPFLSESHPPLLVKLADFILFECEI